jgi:hypothetical protein
VNNLCASETLYDFQVDIKQSNIENSGHGAFLTYLGARVLKAKAAARSSRLIKEHFIYVVGTHDPLIAETLGGRRMNVTLAGDNLHHNNNSVYWSKKRSEMFAAFQKMACPSPHSNSLSPTCESPVDSFDEDLVNCKVHSEVRKLREKIQGDGIGFLGINTESDYT